MLGLWVGIIPGLIIDKIGSKKSFFAAGAILAAAHIVIRIFIATFDLNITLFGWLLYAAGFIGGQGGSLGVMACIAGLMKYYGLQNNTLVSGILMTYFLASQQLYTLLRTGWFMHYSFTLFVIVTQVAGCAFIMFGGIIYKVKEQNPAAMAVKAILLKKGLFVYATNLALLLALWVVMWLLGLFYRSQATIIWVFVSLNLILPFLVAFILKKLAEAAASGGGMGDSLAGAALAGA